MKLDLHKSAQSLRLSLQKAGVDISKLRAQVGINLDVSGSFEDEHSGGMTNALITRLVPWGLVFDPNGEIDMFTFSDGERHAYHVGVVKADTVDGYVRREVIGKVPGWNCGTDYSYVLEENLRHFGWIYGAPVSASKPSGGFFRKIFGGGESLTPVAAASPKKDRSLIIHITDGENSDKDRTKKILAESEARMDEVYFLFIGFSNQGGDFPFLKEIGDRFSNTGLVVVRDLREFTNQSDDELNQALLGQELINWLKAS